MAENGDRAWQPALHRLHGGSQVRLLRRWYLKLLVLTSWATGIMMAASSPQPADAGIPGS